MPRETTDLEAAHATRMLVVARWPLGGIRTYMRNMFGRLPSGYRVTIVAASSHEDAALRDDAAGYRAELVIVPRGGLFPFVREIRARLGAAPYDVVVSQGFVSAVALFLANLGARLPHVLTVHGVVEEKYLEGVLGRLKRFLLGRILSRITVIYLVGGDMLGHLCEQFPRLQGERPRKVVIPNGIETDFFRQPRPAGESLRRELGLAEGAFLFGFFGRFMPQKGFDLLIEAVGQLARQEETPPFAVVAFGSGDYLSHYRQIVAEKGLEGYIHFRPFQPEIRHLYRQVQAVVMPSRWEAGSLLAMEALCAGTPLVAASCIGLRETVADTPSVTFPSEDVAGLAQGMRRCLDASLGESFEAYAETARNRYDVGTSAARFVQLIESVRH